MRHTTACVALVLLAAAVACSDSPGLIADEAGTYVLRTVGDSSVPFVQYASNGYESDVLADTLVLDGRGSYTAVYVSRITQPGQESTVQRSVAHETYTRRGNVLSLSFRCPPNALCARPLVGHLLVPEGIRTFSLDEHYPQPVSRFERVR